MIKEYFFYVFKQPMYFVLITTMPSVRESSCDIRFHII